MKVLVEQEKVKEFIGKGLTSYRISNLLKIPYTVCEGIRHGNNRPYFFTKDKTNAKDICERCHVRKKHPGFVKLCLFCHKRGTEYEGF